jgi:O-antigen ligase
MTSQSIILMKPLAEMPIASMTTQPVATGRLWHRLLDPARFSQAADWMAVAVAASLPWSTSLSGILIGIWLLCIIPTLDWRSLRWAVTVPAAAIPLALVAYGVIAMAWGGASFEEQWGSIKPTLRFLAFPLLFIQFRRSERGMWVLGGFLVSCTLLLAVSWLLSVWPIYVRPNNAFPGVPTKDYIIQSGEFLICAFALAHLSISAWREQRRKAAAGLAALAIVFLLNIAFVAVARSTLIIFAVLLILIALQRFAWKGALAVLVAGAVLAGLAWVTSPNLRARVYSVANEVQDYRFQDEATSSGLRLEFWRKSLQLIVAAPVFGHGTGTVLELFRKLANEGEGASAVVTDQPHNQTFQIAIQLGFVGAALLFGLWISHLFMFRGGGLIAWLGVGVVVQNIVACIFNTYLLEFTLGWIYVFGVGVLGGMTLRQRAPGS